MIFTACFSLKNGIPFSVYGDAVFLSFQNVVIINLIWIYNREIANAEKLFVSIFMIVLLLILLDGTQFEHEVWDLILNGSTAMNILAKLP